MRWRDMRESGNVEDRRGMGGFGGGGGFGGFRPSGMGGMGGLGIGGIVIVLLVSWLFGVNPMSLLDQSGGSGYETVPAESGRTGTPTDDAGKFAGSILGDTEDFWGAYFANAGSQYPKTTMVLYEDQTPSACGTGQAAMGPFYCPSDHKVYLDLSFFSELERRFGAPGEFAQAYVIAHEVGHHVQTTLGVLNDRSGLSRTQANAISVQQELQADCLAGMWGRSAATRNKLEPGDVDDGLRAAAAIGDDRLQRQSSGRVVPESFTHGSSEQRVAAVKQGLNSTDMSGCGIRMR